MKYSFDVSCIGCSKKTRNINGYCSYYCQKLTPIRIFLIRKSIALSVWTIDKINCYSWRYKCLCLIGWVLSFVARLGMRNREALVKR